MHRNLLKWGWYEDHSTCRLFVHLLLKANHSDGVSKGVLVKTGQLKTGRKILAQDTGLSEQQIRTSLNKLKSTSDITITPETKYSIITITNWEKYQSFDELPTSNATNNQPTINQQSTTNNNDNNDNNDNNIIGAHPPKKKPPKKATRIPNGDDWQPDETDMNYAVQKGYLNAQIDALADKFRDYYLAATGKGSTALDWRAKWRTWVRNDISYNGNPDDQRQGKNPAPNGGRSPGSVAEAFAQINLHNREREMADNLGGNDWPDIGDGKIIDH